MEALLKSYQDQLKAIAKDIQASELLATYLESEEEEDYQALRDAFEPALAELHETVASHLDPFTGDDELGELLLLDDQDGEETVNAIDPKDPATWGKVGRNDQCPCGSGKKYKHCHGAYA